MKLIELPDDLITKILRDLDDDILNMLMVNKSLLELTTKVIAKLINERPYYWIQRKELENIYANYQGLPKFPRFMPLHKVISLKKTYIHRTPMRVIFRILQARKKNNTLEAYEKLWQFLQNIENEIFSKKGYDDNPNLWCYLRDKEELKEVETGTDTKKSVNERVIDIMDSFGEAIGIERQDSLSDELDSLDPEITNKIEECIKCMPYFKPATINVIYERVISLIDCCEYYELKGHLGRKVYELATAVYPKLKASEKENLLGCLRNNILNEQNYYSNYHEEYCAERRIRKHHYLKTVYKMSEDIEDYNALVADTYTISNLNKTLERDGFSITFFEEINEIISKSNLPKSEKSNIFLNVFYFMLKSTEIGKDARVLTPSGLNEQTIKMLDLFLKKDFINLSDLSKINLSEEINQIKKIRKPSVCMSSYTITKHILQNRHHNTDINNSEVINLLYSNPNQLENHLFQRIIDGSILIKSYQNSEIIRRYATIALKDIYFHLQNDNLKGYLRNHLIALLHGCKFHPRYGDEYHPRYGDEYLRNDCEYPEEVVPALSKIFVDIEQEKQEGTFAYMFNEYSSFIEWNKSLVSCLNSEQLKLIYSQMRYCIRLLNSYDNLTLMPSEEMQKQIQSISKSLPFVFTKFTSAQRKELIQLMTTNYHQSVSDNLTTSIGWFADVDKLELGVDESEMVILRMLPFYQQQKNEVRYYTKAFDRVEETLDVIVSSALKHPSTLKEPRVCALLQIT